MHLSKQYGLSTRIDYSYSDLFSLPQSWIGTFDGIFLIHTLLTFNEFEKPLIQLMTLNPKWIAIKSLFYDGPLDVMIHIKDHRLVEDNPKENYNIFSVPRIKQFLEFTRYEGIFERFKIGIELARPKGKGPGTYTRNLDNNPRAEFTSPVYLPWYFCLLKRKH
jgi:hypothetical protein